MRTGRWLAAALAGAAGVGAALGVAACGGGGKVPATITTNLPGPITQASAPSTASTASSTTASATTASTPAPAPAGTTSTGITTTGSTGSGAGASEGTRVPAIFALRAGRLTPPTVSVPAFLAVEVTVTTTDASAHTVLVKAGKGYTIHVPPRGSGTVKVPGQKAGRVQVLVDGKPRGAIAWGGEPGP